MWWPSAGAREQSISTECWRLHFSFERIHGLTGLIRRRICSDDAKEAFPTHSPEHLYFRARRSVHLARELGYDQEVGVEDTMLGKCANPVCLASFRRLGSGKLFAFESVMKAESPETTSKPRTAKMGQAPAFFWLCETCSVTFTLGLDAVGQLTLQRTPDGAGVMILDRCPLDHAG